MLDAVDHAQNCSAKCSKAAGDGLHAPPSPRTPALSSSRLHADCTAHSSTPPAAWELGARRLPLYSTAEPLAPSPHPAAPPLCPNHRQAASEQLRSTRKTPLPPLNRAAAPQLLPSLS